MADERGRQDFRKMLSNVFFFLEVANFDKAAVALQDCEVVVLLSSKDQLSEVFTKNL